VIVRIPLSVLYRIFDDDRRVDVLAVKFGTIEFSRSAVLARAKSWSWTKVG
jgi:hypothetical protein